MPTETRRIEMTPLSAIKPAVRNPKQHDSAGIAGSISRFGIIETPIIDERTGRLIGGHGRVEDLVSRLAAGQEPPDGIDIGVNGEWLVPVQRGWASRDDSEADAAAIALNRLTEVGGWDTAQLAAILDELAGTPLSLEGLGFDTNDLDDLIAKMQEETLAFVSEEGHDVTQGAQNEPSLDERAQKYAGKGVRSLVLDYSVDDFDILAADCARLRRHLTLDSNAAVVKALILKAAADLPEE